MGWVGWAAVDWARGRAPDAGSQSVLWGVAIHCDECGVCKVGVQVLVSECVRSDRSVREHLQTLENARLIARLRRYGRGSRLSDWTVLAPFGEDRGRLDPVETKHPELAAKLAARYGQSLQGASGEPCRAQSEPEANQNGKSSSTTTTTEPASEQQPGGGGGGGGTDLGNGTDNGHVSDDRAAVATQIRDSLADAATQTLDRAYLGGRIVDTRHAPNKPAAARRPRKDHR